MDTSNRLTLYDGNLILHQRGEGKKAAVWHYRLRKPTGEIERKTTGARELGEAVKIAEDEYRNLLWRHERGLSLSGLLFEDAAHHWIAERRRLQIVRGKKTVHDQAVVTLEKYTIPYFKGRRLADITTGDVDRYHVWRHADWLAKRDGKRVVYRVRSSTGREYPRPLRVEIAGTNIKEPKAHAMMHSQSVIAAIFDLAVQNGHVTRTEVPGFKRVPAPARRRGAFSPAQQATLLAHLEARITATPAPHHQRGRRLLLNYVRLHLLTGLRPGIESRIRFRDLEFKTDPVPHVVLQVRDGKRGAREVIVADDLRAVIEDIRAHHPCPAPDALLWQTSADRATRGFMVQFKAALREIGMTKDDAGADLTLYSLRHSYITDRITVLRETSDVIGLNCGTSPLMIQNHYAHLSVHNHVDRLARSLKRGNL